MDASQQSLLDTHHDITACQILHHKVQVVIVLQRTTPLQVKPHQPSQTSSSHPCFCTAPTWLLCILWAMLSCSQVRQVYLE